MADVHVPIRAGSDIAFLGGLINYVLSPWLEFRDYVVAYTNAPTILREDFQDTEDLGGLFSGYDAEGAIMTRTAGSTRASRPPPRPADRGSRRPGRSGAARPRPATPMGRAARPRRGASRARPDAAASALRLPGAEAALRALHA